MTGILEKLKWESLKEKRNESRLIMLYKGLKGAVSIPMNDLVPPIRHIRKHHSLTLHTLLANTDTYKCSLGERGGSVVECRTPEREVRGSRPTSAVLCP